MHHFRTILVAADFSASSCEAFQVACSLAHERKSRIFVLFVAEPKYAVPEPTYVGQQPGPLTVVEREPTYFDAVKDRLCEVYAPHRPIDVEYHTRVGAAAEEILRAAHEVHPDLIVLGTHGRTGLRRMLAGSVAETVLRRAPCPVLALRFSSQPQQPTEKIRVILHPTDLSEQTPEALHVARSLARDHGARLVLIHVAPEDVVAEGIVIEPVDLEACRESLEETRSALDGPDLEFPIATLTTQGDAAAEILRAAKATEADLIVMGSHGRSGLERFLMGSVAEAVLRRASCPTLIIKPAQIVPGRVPAAAGHKSVFLL